MIVAGELYMEEKRRKIKAVKAEEGKHSYSKLLSSKALKTKYYFVNKQMKC